MLNDIQRDALRECINIGIGRAGEMLSEMIESRVDLCIPYVEVVTLKANEQIMIGNSFSHNLGGQVISASLRFGKEFQGRAHLLFPTTRICKLLEHFSGETRQWEEAAELSAADIDVIREIGNIILNAIMGSLSDLLEVRLEFFVPEVDFCSLYDLKICEHKDNQETYLVVIQASFSVRDINLAGAILIILSFKSISVLVEKIDYLLQENNE